MACNSYSNNASPQVVFAMSNLPPGFCPADYQALFDAIPDYLSGVLPTNFSTFLISDTEPVLTDRDKLWVKVAANCRPLGFYLYSAEFATWLPVVNQMWNGDATGTANALACAFAPELFYLTDGHLFIVKAGAAANTGAVTLNPSGLGSLAVTKFGEQALEGGEILPGALLLLTYREDTPSYFELLNPAPSAAAIVPVNRLINGSFEVDSDEDGQPDGWAFTGPAAGAISESEVAHGRRSYAFNGAGGLAGTLAMIEPQPCNGSVLYAEGEMLFLSFWHRTQDVLNADAVQVTWFDSDGTTVLAGPTTVWTQTSTVADSWKRMHAALVPFAGARFFKLALLGNVGGAGSGTSWFDGLAIETVTFQRRCEFRYAGSATTFPTRWECPLGVTRVRVTAVGGGGGGCTPVPINGGGGGGAGGTVLSVIPVVPGVRYAVVVGAGGIGNAVGNNTTFDAAGTNVIANGGQQGGTGGSYTNPGVGGGGALGTNGVGWVFTGGDGQAGNPTPSQVAGHGGSGAGGGGEGGTGGAVGGAGSQYGGGGGGGSSNTGGAGGAGYLLIEY